MIILKIQLLSEYLLCTHEKCGVSWYLPLGHTVVGREDERHLHD